MNLQKTVSKFSYVVQYIVDDLDDSILENMTHARLEQLESDSRKLYGLIHARYIITIKGLQKMYAKYKEADFGRCPRVYCNLQQLLPVGLHDIPGIDCVKLYCPSCEDRSTSQLNAIFPPSPYLLRLILIGKERDSTSVMTINRCSIF